MQDLGTVGGLCVLLVALQGCGRVVNDVDAHAGAGGVDATGGNAAGGVRIGPAGAGGEATSPAGSAGAAGAANAVVETTDPKGRLILNQQVDWLVVDESRLYWLTEPAGISGCMKEQCGETVLRYSPDATSFPAIGKDHVYWYAPTVSTSTGGAVSCPKTGCTDVPFALGAPYFRSAADGDFLYFQYANGIARCSYAGCGDEPQLVVQNETFRADQIKPIRFQGAYAYWLDASAVRRALKDGGSGPAQTLAVGPAKGVFDVSSRGVFWLDASERILSCPLTGCGDQSPTVVYANASPKGYLRADDLGVYWKEDDAVHFCAAEGCTTPQVLTTSNVIGFDIDDRFVYWNHTADAESPPLGTGIGTTIRRVLKPGASAP